jgi:hypothetical protein
MGEQRAAVKERLDRRARRPVLAALGSVWITVVRGSSASCAGGTGPGSITYRGHAIPHRSVARPGIRSRSSYGSRDIYCYEYTPRLNDVILDIGAGVATRPYSLLATSDRTATSLP